MAWADRVKAAPAELRTEFERRNDGVLPADWTKAIAAARSRVHRERQGHGDPRGERRRARPSLRRNPGTVGRFGRPDAVEQHEGEGQVEIRPGEYNGSYMHYGVREHGMAAAMNGISLHGGLIPYGGTFLCFTDYCRPSIRLASLMQIRTIFVMTHDSIGLGEDGPTHQPVEHLAALRAIPHLAVYRPGDPVETAECWELILDTPRQAAVIALSRQPMPLLRRESGDENRSAKGGYVLLEAEGGQRRLTIMSTGSELHLAVAARDLMQKEGIPTAVVSMPCRLLFEKQDSGLQEGGSRRRPVRASRWKRRWRWAGSGISASKGASSACTASARPARSRDVYKKFDINAEAVVRAAHETLAEVAAL